MSLQMKTGKRGLALIKEFEGWEAKAYRDAVGVWTIGYGHTAMAGPPKPRPGMTITKAEGERILQKDLRKYEQAVIDALTVEVNQNQFDALVSFCYNVGAGNLRKSSVLKRTNARRFSEVPGRLMLWNKAGGRVLRGLTRRRKAEGELFMLLVPHEDRQEPKLFPDPTPPKKQTHWLVNLLRAIWRLFKR